MLKRILIRLAALLLAPYDYILVPREERRRLLAQAQELKALVYDLQKKCGHLPPFDPFSFGGGVKGTTTKEDPFKDMKIPDCWPPIADGNNRTGPPRSEEP